MKEHKSQFLHYRRTIALGRFYFNNPYRSIDITNTNLIIPCIITTDGPEKESFEIVVRINEVCINNISFIIPKCWFHVLKKSFTTSFIHLMPFNITTPHIILLR